MKTLIIKSKDVDYTEINNQEAAYLARKAQARITETVRNTVVKRSMWQRFQAWCGEEI